MLSKLKENSGFLISKYGKVTNHKNNIKCSIKKFVYIRSPINFLKFLRLKQFLSKYKTKLPLVPIAFASARKRGEVQCYMFGLSEGTLISQICRS